MKHGKKLLLLLSLWFFPNLCAKETKVSVTFDALFPQTTLKEMVDVIMQIWSNMVVINEKLTENEKDEIADLLIGQLFRVTILLDRYRQDDILIDDLHYLESLLAQLEQEVKIIKNHIKKSSARLISVLLDKAKKKIIQEYLE